MQNIIDKVFQIIINYFTIKKKYKLYKVFFFFFKNLIKGPFILNFDEYKFFSSPQKKNLSRWMLKNLKPWDLSTINLINNLLANDKSIFIDCGVNYGAYSIPISKKKINSTIVCFDPSKKALNDLKKNIKLNNSKNIEYYNYGISDTISKSSFSDDISDFKNSGEYSFIKSKSSYRVETTTLDVFFKNFNFKIYKIIIIKLDIEGYEFNALMGMEKILRKDNVVVFFELSRMMLNNKNFNFKNFTKFININNLYILDLNLNRINIKDILNKFSMLEKKKNTIGDYILVKNTFDNIERFKK
jgi:FkbM family methyltransferase